MKLLDKFRKLLRLSGGEMRLLISAYSWLMVLRLGLLLMPFNRLRKMLAQLRWKDLPAHQDHEQNLKVVSQVVWAVNVSSRQHLFSMNCFPRALAAYVLLRRRGIPVEIQIGVARSAAGVFEAHAWVEYHGQIVIGNLEDLTRFVPLPRLNEKLV